MKLTDEHLDSIATELIPLLDEVANLAMDDDNDLDGRDIKFREAGDTGGFTLPGAEQLTWVIEGQAVMVTSIPEPRRDGSYRIVLSPSENWVVKSVLTSGLDLSTEIELILAPRI